MIPLGTDPDARSPGNLRLELDNIDITDLIDLADGRLRHASSSTPLEILPLLGYNHPTIRPAAGTQ